MNKYVKKWVAALRSGEYEQGQGSLFLDGKYCCLGVACEILKEELGLKVENYVDGTRLEKTYDGFITSLPSSVTIALNLESECGDFIGMGSQKDCLINLNDVDGLTFAEIADVIESEPEGLFRS